ncbi:hypothetical protein [Cupriavidus pauculus]|uniref:hypothetical protein n=1 Tax=Cupriavidus pauculus TaxID=82633 RepID=UPI0011AF597F|nr:hypothetical protein [Cupriavidus pauculus]
MIVSDDIFGMFLAEAGRRTLTPNETGDPRQFIEGYRSGLETDPYGAGGEWQRMAANGVAQ